MESSVAAQASDTDASNALNDVGITGGEEDGEDVEELTVAAPGEQDKEVSLDEDRLGLPGTADMALFFQNVCSEAFSYFLEDIPHNQRSRSTKR